MKTLKALGMVASLGMGAVLVIGCNPDEPAKTSTPPPTPVPSAKAPAKSTDAKGEAPKPISKDTPK